jgi:small GTP-binding protein
MSGNYDTMSSAIHDLTASMRQAGDEVHAARMEQLLDKNTKGQLYIAFCGHFSAGKSSLINRLCGTQLLPSSPIPTSANIVSIADGEARAEVYSTQGGEPRTVPLAELEEACKDGDHIQTVRLYYPLPFLGGQAVLLDTPGIDSTDQAHMAATESALHLADVVFYVMDYNHVQSEINFGFTKRLKEWGKPVYLIVNQIDKHREDELSFDTYADSVRNAFAGWGIEPDGILYTTLRQPDHPRNDYRVLQALIAELAGLRGGLIAESVQDSLRHLIKEHGKVLAERHAEEKEALRSELDESGGEEALSRLAELDAQAEVIRGMPAELTARWKKEIQALLDNANITPAATRDLAQHYLDSRKPGFRAGLFSGAAKTAQEISRRLEAFQRDYADKVKVELELHLRNQLKRSIGELKDRVREDEVDALEELLQAADRLQLEVTPEWLAGEVHSGASFSGEYTLNYCRHIASEVKAMYRRQALELAERAQRLAEASAAREAAALERERAELRSRLGAFQRLQALEAEERAAVEALERRLAAVPAAAAALPDLAALAANTAPAASLRAQAPAAAPAGGDARGVPAASAGARPAAPRGSAAALVGAHRARMAAAAELLSAAAASAAALPALAAPARAMRDKAARLRGSRFTIALFGAFSAGKSSFANALMGERVLPVSPNPTTAAINRIVPPTSEWPHGMAKVLMKTAETILADVRYSLSILGHEVDDMSAGLKVIRGISPADVAPAGRPHYTFLRAVSQGWADAEAILGQEKRADLAQFREFVADEHKSCFVEEIELYYSCPLTDQGIILVDTPGADSINARHTGVAFNYMKNADAILFVTYYNHAFSQADREVLLQLGRVKDSLEMDKMFFVVNAADLASSDHELQGVIAHVERNLLQHGIRNPRIYPISSLNALEAKQQGDEPLIQSSGIAAFEKQFIQFAFDELSDLTVHSAQKDLERAMSTLKQWIDETDLDEERRRERLKALAEAESKAADFLKEDALADNQELNNELHELLYYVNQRLFYRFGGLYQYAFNPATLRDEGAGIRTMLRTAALELHRMVSMNVSQEVLATTLRAEKWIHAAADGLAQDWTARIDRWLPGFSALPGELPTLLTPKVEEQIGPVDVEEKWLAASFKTPKFFFEGEGSKLLRQALEEKYKAPVSDYLRRHEEQLLEEYTAQWKVCSDLLRQGFLDASAEYAAGLKGALERKNDPDQLRQKLEELRLLHARLADNRANSSAETSAAAESAEPALASAE